MAIITGILFASAALCRTAVATETEHTDLRILPAPGKVVVDGKYDDWDLTGSIFICSDVENYRDQFASWQSAMYDSENLYLLSRWIDTTPMNNPGICGSDMGFQGDCLQVRFITGPSGKVPDSRGDDAALGQKTTHVSAWKGKDGRDIIDLAYGKKFDEGGVKDAKKEGAKQAFQKTPDAPSTGSGQAKGYVQEIAIPWKLLTKDGHAPKPGDTFIMTYEPNFGTSSKLRISTKDLFRAGVTPDRVFAFCSYDRWGMAKFEASGKVSPQPMRLSDGREFPVAMKDGVPVIDLKGLYKEDKLEGFAKLEFEIPDDGFVSIIIKNTDGMVVRNLANAKFMTKGKQEILWDGLATPSDRKPGDPVPAGEYKWEGIWHKGIGLSLVGWACNAGKAPFDSPGGNWGGDQGPPVSVDSDNENMFLGWAASEAGQALVCTDFDGNVKWRHKRGGFGGAQLVAVDNGIVYVYDSGQGNVIYRLDTKKGEYSNWKDAGEATLELGKIMAQFKPASADPKEEPAASGLAATGGKLFVSYGSINAAWGKKQASGDLLLMIDGTTGKLIKSVKTENPGDIKTGADGKLYMLGADSKVSIVNPETGESTPVIDGLKNARSVAADKDGNIYVSISDPENQIKVFDPSTGSGQAKPIRAIGKQGGRSLTGPWEKNGVRFAVGIKVDPKGKLWVMECDNAPKRISRWDAATGNFEKEFFGSTDYGAGGGAICPADPYTMIGQGCEWKLSPETGRAECVAAISRVRWANARFGTGKDGRVYAAIGGGWPKHLPVNIFERVSAGNWKLRTVVSTDEEEKDPVHITVWSDRNDDQQEQPDEVKKYELALGGWIDGWYLYFNQAMAFSGGTHRLDVTGWTPCGAPEYDISKAVKMPAPEDVGQRGGMGAQKDLASEDGNYVLYNGHYGTEHSDFTCFDIRSGKKVFAYPNNYVGVHGGHLAPPAKTGLIRGAYDIAGTVKAPPPLENLFFIGTDKGEWHILSSSGYYVSKLFEGDPMRIKWPDEAVPGANMNCVPPGMGAEDFGGSVIKANDENVYVQCGKTAFIDCKLTGIDTVKPLSGGNIRISAEDTETALGFKEKYLNVAAAVKNFKVAKKTVAFTGNPSADFGAEATEFGPDNAKIKAWLAHDDANLYAAWQVNDQSPWINGATGFENLYACGDTVDFQIGTDASADKIRNEAVKGDLRLSIGSLQGKNVAVVYRKVSDEKAPKTFYSGTCKDGYTMEYAKMAEGVKIGVKPAQDGKSYVVEAAIPLKDLGMSAASGVKLSGDIGATFSDPAGKDTNLRVYWSNQAAGIVADEVEELRMQPSKWGELIFE